MPSLQSNFVFCVKSVEIFEPFTNYSFPCLYFLFVTAPVMASEAFSSSNRVLRVKRRAFSREITSFLNDVRSGVGVSKEAFNEKRDYFENIWEEIVATTEGCINLVDDGDDEGEEIIEELRDHLERLQEKKERFTDLEMEIDKRLFDVTDTKCIELADGEPRKRYVRQLPVGPSVMSSPLHLLRNLKTYPLMG